MFKNYRIKKEYYQILDDLDREFVFSVNNTEYPIIKDIIKKDIEKYGDQWRLNYYKDTDHRIPLYFAILNTSRMLLESGRYHFGMGTLLPNGKELVEVFNKCLTCLIETGKTTKEVAEQAKKDLEEAISSL